MHRGIARCLFLFTLLGLLSFVPQAIAAGEALDEATEGAVETQRGAAEDDDTLVPADDEHEDEEHDDEDDHEADFESLIQMMGKDMNVNLPQNDMSKFAAVLKELTDHIDSAHKQHAEIAEKPHPFLKKIMSQRTHDKMVTTLQKIYTKVPRDEINDQLQAVMALLQHLKDDPHMSPKQLLEKTATHLGMPLTADMFEDMKKHMGWAEKFFGLFNPGELEEEKAEEL
ncbi:conserved hypothetical protein [Neospora caninum Liverpool]|uniref:Uncharacterized protein n=1 Tax=Neospora caninum (strain Liverpool) TaxID=572307 RepID=F0VMW3_NEOCL|nr:conserved hypothetical protein [Neospora caninum Liverpool]CBZ55059.1 conserved hypothetical protein [Neospora caninum Liverpool]CEL69783.1 TPA: hypothetical protein BN1204_054840 [Neospora caninum Liverpool]|eukprot:XP_003885087.1 conserved hypothetical protein [Neospora caninum Liverpool]